MSPADKLDSEARHGRLLARPLQQTQPTQAAQLSQSTTQSGQGSVATGLLPLHLEDECDGLLYVPSSYRADTLLPLVLMLHGAGGDARGGLTPFLPFADVAGLMMLAPSSQDRSWDVIVGGYGEDVRCIDGELAYVFAHYAVDTSHLAIGGFSDGASYALSLGLINGDLFTHIIAFSPGFMAPTFQQGRPRIFISHGTQDRVLPIERCGRRIVKQLRGESYDVTYREFEGPHTIPVEVVGEAWGWFSVLE